MPYSIEVRFDPACEAAIIALWQQAAEFYGSDYMLVHGVIPHVALIVSEEDLSAVFAHCALRTTAVTFADLGFFAGGSIAHLAVDRALHDLQRACYHTARTLGLPIDPYYTPDTWIPHCTLAQQASRNVGVPLRCAVPCSATATSLILVRYPPTTLLSEKAAEPPA